MTVVLIFLGVWMAVAIAFSLLFGRMYRNPLARVSPRPAEGGTHPVVAADGSPPTGPSRTGSGVRLNSYTPSYPADAAPGVEVVSPATAVDDSAVAGDASTKFPAPIAGKGRWSD